MVFNSSLGEFIMNEISTLKNIPQELKLNGLWCGWRLTENGKEPFNLTSGKHAKSNDETTFSTYASLLNNIHKFLKKYSLFLKVIH